ncbi:MAG: Ig-like domain-containing protein, partial [Pirellulales bacterium]|nr:Ig-like domain-containing protein [Pirellulales bacterium]
TIDASTGVVTVAGAIDRETDGATRSITVRATSHDGSHADQVFVIQISDVNESGATAVADNDGTANAVDENAAVGTSIGVTAFSTDSDSGDTISYSLDDDDGGRFAIDSVTGVVTVAGSIDREIDGASRSIIVRGTSSDGSFATTVFSIAIGDQNESVVTAPLDVDGNANFVAENSAIGSAVGLTALATDTDVSDVVSYSLADSAGGRFAIDTLSGVVTVNGILDFEAASSHQISVRAASSDGSVVTSVFSIAVGNVNEAPHAVADTFSVNGSTPLNLLAPGILANDSDAEGDALTTLLVTAPSHGTLALLSGGGLTYTPDSEFFGTDSFFYRVSDGTLLSNVVEVEISVQTVVPPALPLVEPNPDPESEAEPESETETESDTDEDSEEEFAAAPPATVAAQTATSQAIEQSATVLPPTEASPEKFAGLMSAGSGDQQALRSMMFNQLNSDPLAIEQTSSAAQAESLQRLLNLDIAEAIVWHQWDQTNHTPEEFSQVFAVGTANTALGVFSVGYVFWALRGGAFMAAVSSGIPVWRIVDPSMMLSAYQAAKQSQDVVEKML